MINSWLVLLPTLIVLAIAFITKKVVPALFTGIIVAALIVSDFSLTKTLDVLWTNIAYQIDPSNFYMFGFLIILGSLITMMGTTGGTSAYGNLIKNKIHTAKNIEFTSLFLSLCFAIDEYFNILTVGSIMKPVTDSFNIPRAKLAFFLDSLGAPALILVPVSTWIAMLLMQLEKAGVSFDRADNPFILADPFAFYLQSIPFIFYSLITIASLFFIVRYSISYGPMQQHEQIAQHHRNLFGGKKAPSTTASYPLHTQGSLFDFIMPIGLLLLSIITSILYLGNSWIFGGTHSFLQVIQTVNIFLAFFVGGLTAFILSFFIFFFQKKVSLHSLSFFLKEGFYLMKDSIIILLLAWTFSSLLKNDLKTGEYIASLIIGSMNAAFLPALFFIAALITAAGMGSSWGTIAVHVPLAIPMITTFFNVGLPTSPEHILLIYPVIASIFSGAVAGEHISPIGTTTIMATASAGCYLEDHVSTQFPYAIPSLIATIIAYLIAGFTIHYGIALSSILSLSSGIIIALTGQAFLNICLGKKPHNN